MTRFGALMRKVDERISGIDLPLMSVSQTRGVIRRSELTDRPPRAESLDAYKVCRRGDVVFNKMSIRAGAMGVAHEDGLVTYHYEVMRPIGEVDPRFVVYLMKSHWFTKELILRERGIGAGDQTNVRTTEVPFRVMRTIQCPVPSAQDQRVIADFLDRETAQIDTLISEQYTLIRLLEERRAATVDELIGQSGGTPTALRHVVAHIDQGVSPQAEAGLAEAPESWGVLKSGCVNRGVFRQEEHKLLPVDFAVDPSHEVREGDLLVSRASGSPDLVGSCGLVCGLKYRLILSDKLFRLAPRPSIVDPRFLYWSLNSRRYREQVRGAISGAQGLANNLPLAALRSFKLLIPSLGDQRRIVEHLDGQIERLDMLIREAERLIELARERRAALITAAVTGQIEIPGVN